MRRSEPILGCLVSFFGLLCCERAPFHEERTAAIEVVAGALPQVAVIFETDLPGAFDYTPSGLSVIYPTEQDARQLDLATRGLNREVTVRAYSREIGKVLVTHGSTDGKFYFFLAPESTRNLARFLERRGFAVSEVENLP